MAEVDPIDDCPSGNPQPASERGGVSAADVPPGDQAKRRHYRKRGKPKGAGGAPTNKERDKVGPVNGSPVGPA